MIKFILQNSFQLEQRGQKTLTTFIYFNNLISLAPTTALAQQRTQIGRQTEKQATTR